MPLNLSLLGSIGFNEQRTSTTAVVTTIYLLSHDSHGILCNIGVIFETTCRLRVL